jgi:hypothetical protein
MSRKFVFVKQDELKALSRIYSHLDVDEQTRCVKLLVERVLAKERFDDNVIAEAAHDRNSRLASRTKNRNNVNK